MAIFNNPRLAAPLTITLAPVTTTEQTDISVTIPADAAAESNWVAGFYTVALEVSPKNAAARALYESMGFTERKFRMMTRRLAAKEIA